MVSIQTKHDLTDQFTYRDEEFIRYKTNIELLWLCVIVGILIYTVKMCES